MNFDKPFLCNIYGKCGSGKSHLMHYIIAKLYSEKKFDFIYVITGSNFNNFYQSFLSDDYILPYSDLVLGKFIKFCIKYKNQKKRFLLILDDIAGTVKRNSRVFKYLINNYRQINCQVMIACQYINLIPPDARGNSMYDFVFYQDTEIAVKESYKSNAFGHFKSEKEWGEFLKQNCKEYCCILVNRTSGNKEKRFTLFKAPAKIPNFKIKQ